MDSEFETDVDLWQAMQAAMDGNAWDSYEAGWKPMKRRTKPRAPPPPKKKKKKKVIPPWKDIKEWPVDYNPLRKGKLPVDVMDR